MDDSPIAEPPPMGIDGADAPSHARRRWLVFGVVAACVSWLVVAAFVVLIAWPIVNDPLSDSCGLSDDEAVAWTGFSIPDEAEVTGTKTECWLDQNVSFTLQGTPEVIDAALVDAGFTGSFEPGVAYPVQASLFDDNELASLVSVESATDSVDRPKGGQIYRHLVAGRRDGVAVLLVSAFST